MLKPGPALRIIIHLNEDIGSRTDYLYQEIIVCLHSSGISGATIFRPEAGFGTHHRIHTRGASGVEGEHLPVRIEFVENREKAEAVLPTLLDLVTDGMVEAQETTVLKIAGVPAPAPQKGREEG